MFPNLLLHGCGVLEEKVGGKKVCITRETETLTIYTGA
jgi:hypothetical protein